MPITSLTKVDVLPLSGRAARAIKNDNIIFVGDLIQKSREDLLIGHYTGPVAVNEIEIELAKHGLALGSFDPAWPPANLEAAIAA